MHMSSTQFNPDKTIFQRVVRPTENPWVNGFYQLVMGSAVAIALNSCSGYGDDLPSTPSETGASTPTAAEVQAESGDDCETPQWTGLMGALASDSGVNVVGSYCPEKDIQTEE
jgi:hypothetical protein